MLSCTKSLIEIDMNGDGAGDKVDVKRLGKCFIQHSSLEQRLSFYNLVLSIQSLQHNPYTKCVL